MYVYKFNPIYHKFSKEKKLAEKRTEYNKQYCKKCGHSIIFKIYQEKVECSWCHTLNTNQTKGHFNYMLNKMLERNYKVVKIGEGKNE